MTQLQLHFQRNLCRRFIQMTSCRPEIETVSRMQKLDFSIIVAAISRWRGHLSACVRVHSGHFEHIFGVLLCDYSVYRQNITCLKRSTSYGHCAGEVEDVIIGRLAVVS